VNTQGRALRQAGRQALLGLGLGGGELVVHVLPVPRQPLRHALQRLLHLHDRIYHQEKNRI
jgi:hypothetical protein